MAFKFTVCTRTTTTFGEKVQTSPSNSTEWSYLSYIEANNQLKELQAEYDRVAKEVTDFLYDNLSVEDADLLEWRYVHDKSMQDIAEIKCMAYQTVKNRMSAAEKAARTKYYKSVPKSTEKYPR